MWLHLQLWRASVSCAPVLVTLATGHVISLMHRFVTATFLISCEPRRKFSVLFRRHETQREICQGFALQTYRTRISFNISLSRCFGFVFRWEVANDTFDCVSIHTSTRFNCGGKYFVNVPMVPVHPRRGVHEGKIIWNRLMSCIGKNDHPWKNE